MAVILITGLLLVVSVVSLQQNLESNRVTELKENSAICDHVTTLIDSIGRFSGQSEVLIVLPKPIWIQKGPENANDFILFNAELTGYFCRLQTRLSFGEQETLSINAGVVYIYKNADNEVVISNSPPLNSSLYHGPGDPTCVPNTCTGLGANCGTPSNGCGGFLSCGSCGAQICNSVFQCEECTSQTCPGLGFQCGTADNGCGVPLNCGDCASQGTLAECINHSCVCTPNTCSDINGGIIGTGEPCTNLDNGCAGQISCRDNCYHPANRVGICNINGLCEVSTCTNDCPSIGYQECVSSTTYRTCGNYDTDPCYEWGTLLSRCLNGQTCSNGYCLGVIIKDGGTTG
ncbi:MAG: hypothetical protein V1777_03010 [Candidatus Micrarchaeota archaeon]